MNVSPSVPESTAGVPMLAASAFEAEASSARDAELNPAKTAHWFVAAAQPHERALRGYLRHQFPTVDTDDVVQESYLRLLRVGARGKVESVKAYFFTIARHTALRLFQRREKLFSHAPVEDLPEWRVIEASPAAAELMEAEDRLVLVARAVDGLPPRCRAIVRRAIVDGQSPGEIARNMSLSESTVRGQLAIGIRRCTEFLRARGEAP